jgi:RNA polymerase sigma factor (sigma-70 family)
MTSLEGIILSCKKKEELGRKQLYELFSPVMRAVCLRYLGHPADAEDLLHDGFIKVFQFIHQYNGKGSFEGWMKRIFINAAFDHLKQRKKSISFSDQSYFFANQYSITETSEHPDIQTRKAQIMSMDISSEELMEVLKELPDGYRLVFNMFAIEKMTHKEIAKMLRITEGTSKSQLNRARRILQEKLLLISMKKQEDEEISFRSKSKSRNEVVIADKI